MKTRRIICILLALLTVFVLAGCGKEKKLGEKAVAKVNGHEITYADYYELLQSYAPKYYATAQNIDDMLGIETANQVRRAVIDDLISQKLLIDQAKSLGYGKLSDDEKKDLQSRLDKHFADLLDKYIDKVKEEEPDLSAEETKSKAQTRMDEYIKDSGYTKSYMYQYYFENIMLEKLYADLIKDVSVSGNEMSDAYDKYLEEQKELEKSDPAIALRYYYLDYNDVNVYVPAGKIRVKHILIGFDDETKAKINALEGEEKEKFYRKELKKLLPEAQSVLKKAKAGMDFDSLIEKHNDDPGVKAEANKNGYEMYLGSGMSDNFEKAALELENVGDITHELVETEHGYHIIKLEEIFESRVIEYSEVKDQIYDLLYEDKKNAAWNNNIKELMDKANIERYEDMYIAPEIY